MKKSIDWVLATTVITVLAGCQTPLPITKAPSPLRLVSAAQRPAAAAPAVALPPVAAPTTPSVRVSAVQADTSEEGVAEQELDDEMDGYEILAEESSGYSLQAVVVKTPFLGLAARIGLAAGFWARLKADVRKLIVIRRTANHIQDRRAVLARMALKQAVVEAIRNTPWVDNGDGTKTKAVQFDHVVTLNNLNQERHVEASITVNSQTKALILAKCEIGVKLINGANMTATREKTLQEDGSYMVTFHSETVYRTEGTRVADWTKTIALDGKVHGTGTVVFTNAKGKVVNTVSRTWDAQHPVAGCITAPHGSVCPADLNEGTEAESGADGLDDAADANTTPLTIPAP